MTIKLSLVPSQLQKTVSIDLSDLDKSEQEWADMSGDERRAAIDEYIANFDQPYWDIDKVEYQD